MDANITKETLFCRRTIKELVDPRDMENNPIPPVRFFIPAYQRGYRWRKEEIKQLLDDIWEFQDNREKGLGKKDDFYCLQPVVVKELEDATLGDYEVIDGQQRLTSIFIILQALNHYSLIKTVGDFATPEFLAQKPYSPIFTIRYETREDSAVWLPRINDESFCEENIDYYHIRRAYDQTKEWLDEKERNGATDPENTIKKALLDNVQVIWYEADEKTGANNAPIDIFNRLNSGKIDLNNAELIKALLLQERNFVTVDKDGKETADVTRQAQIALEWDEMEKLLQRDDFWGFIYCSGNPLKYDTRMEYIFDLMTEKTKEKSHRYTFDCFYSQYQEMRLTPREFVEEKWKEVQKYMLTLQQWFDDRTLYHYIGYLIEYTTPEKNLIQELKKLEQEPIPFKDDEGNEIIRRIDKSEFLNIVKDKIRDVLKIKKASELRPAAPKDLNYNQKSGIVRKVLLLYNMQTLLNNKDSDAKFPLDLYKKGNWDVEHIASQTDFQLTKDKCVDWVHDIVRYITGISFTDEKDYEARVEEFKKTQEEDERELVSTLMELIRLREEGTITDKNIQEAQAMVNSHFKCEHPVSDTQKDYIWNLALLNASINRSYQNAIFPVKRMYIIDNESRGVFVPICTKNTFQKVYSKKLSELMCWDVYDAAAYWEDICRVLGKEKFLSDAILNHKPVKEEFVCQNS